MNAIDQGNDLFNALVDGHLTPRQAQAIWNAGLDELQFRKIMAAFIPPPSAAPAFKQQDPDQLYAIPAYKPAPKRDDPAYPFRHIPSDPPRY